jgi:hypothetical protein
MRALVNHSGALEEIFVRIANERFSYHPKFRLEIQIGSLSQELERLLSINRSELLFAWDIVNS